MLRPEKMCRVSVTGSKRVMEPVIEAVHDLDMLHVTEYDGSWDGFEPGDPVEGADAASDQLVTVRALESILDVDAEDAGPTRIVTDEALEEELGEIRERVNELEDRRDEIRTELGDVEDALDGADRHQLLGGLLGAVNRVSRLESVPGPVVLGDVEQVAVVDRLDDVVHDALRSRHRDLAHLLRSEHAPPPRTV